MRTPWVSVGIGFVLVVAATLGAPRAVHAEGIKSPRTEQALRKLGRGVTNIATCPAELLRVPYLVGRQDGFLAASSVGFLQGAWRMVLRGLVGVFEVTTFYAEVPKDYKPLVMPEFVWAHGNWAE